MNNSENFLGAKDFSYFIPSLLENKYLQKLLRKEFNILEGDVEIFENELKDDVHDFLKDYISENAEEIDGFEVNFNEDSSESDFNFYCYTVREMKGVFLTECSDDDTRYFDTFEKAKGSIEINHGVKFNNAGGYFAYL